MTVLGLHQLVGGEFETLLQLANKRQGEIPSADKVDIGGLWRVILDVLNTNFNWSSSFTNVCGFFCSNPSWFDQNRDVPSGDQLTLSISGLLTLYPYILKHFRIIRGFLPDVCFFNVIWYIRWRLKLEMSSHTVSWQCMFRVCYVPFTSYRRYSVATRSK